MLHETKQKIIEFIKGKDGVWVDEISDALKLFLTSVSLMTS